LGGGASQDHEQDAGLLDGGGLLGEDEESEEDAEGCFEGHQRAERGLGHMAQGEQLEGEREDGQQDREAGRSGQDAWGDVPGGLGDAQPRRRWLRRSGR
jgi:hypothetical protein